MKPRYVIEDGGKWATLHSLQGPVCWTDNPLLRYEFDSEEQAEAFRVHACGGRGNVVRVR